MRYRCRLAESTTLGAPSFKACFISARAFSRLASFSSRDLRKESHPPNTRICESTTKVAKDARHITEDMQIVLSLPYGPLFPAAASDGGRIFCITVAREWYYET